MSCSPLSSCMSRRSMKSDTDMNWLINVRYAAWEESMLSNSFIVSLWSSSLKTVVTDEVIWVVPICYS